LGQAGTSDAAIIGLPTDATPPITFNAMTLPFVAIAALTVVSSIAAMSLRRLVHCALSAALAFAGLAAAYLNLDAQFVGFAQILVYVGAVAILIVFAILLTRGSEPAPESEFSSSWAAGLCVAALVWFCLSGAILLSLPERAPAIADVSGEATVQKIGFELMTRYVLPLEILGLLLTAAAIGAVIIAMQEKASKP
jgi:NADH:ubiquinone oxidoreductase subunit 6 (subunit J)